MAEASVKSITIFFMIELSGFATAYRLLKRRSGRDTAQRF